LVAEMSFFVIVVLELLGHVLIDGVDQVEHLQALLLESLEEGALLNLSLRLSGDVVDALLVLLHAGDVVLE